jgi:hypothetical protein
MLNRQRLLWAFATRRQLERWEPLPLSLLVVPGRALPAYALALRFA